MAELVTTTLSGPRGALVSVEGISGVGKSYLTTLFLQDSAFTAISEFSQRLSASTGALGHQILRAMSDEAHGEHFLRSGHPRTETSLLIAVKTFDFEQCRALLAAGRTVIEGRSLDSIAVYQSLITYPGDPDRAVAEARQILALAAQWRPLPDLTVLLTDDVGVAVGRAEVRDSRQFTAEQHALHQQAADMFTRLAAEDPDRFCIIDRRITDLTTAIGRIKDRLSAVSRQLGEAPASATSAQA